MIYILSIFRPISMCFLISMAFITFCVQCSWSCTISLFPNQNSHDHNNCTDDFFITNQDLIAPMHLFPTFMCNCKYSVLFFINYFKKDFIFVFEKILRGKIYVKLNIVDHPPNLSRSLIHCRYTQIIEINSFYTVAPTFF